MTSNRGFIHNHLKVFGRCFTDRKRHDDAAVGTAPAQWASDFALLGIPNSAELCRRPVTRKFLKSVCTDAQVDPLHAYVCVMAWGNQGRPGRRNVVTSWENRCEIAKRLLQLRSGNWTPQKAFGLFSEDPIKGLGPSYYSKLISFFRPNDSLYILDKFTRRSSKLLGGDDFNCLIDGRPVEPSSYARFCLLVDRLADHFDVDGWAIEEGMFSKDAHGVGEWRKYVRAQFPPRRFRPDPL